MLVVKSSMDSAAFLLSSITASSNRPERGRVRGTEKERGRGRGTEKERGTARGREGGGEGQTRREGGEEGQREEGFIWSSSGRRGEKKRGVPGNRERRSVWDRDTAL